MKRSISFSIFQYNYLHLMRPQHTLYHQYIFSNHLIGRVGAKWFLCDILHFRCIGMARLAGVYPAAKCLARTESGRIALHPSGIARGSQTAIAVAVQIIIMAIVIEHQLETEFASI